MAVDQAVLQELHADYQTTTGSSCKEFFCPILLEDGVGSGLMDGHILPAGLKKASRTTVIQRADVDNYFGSTIEPDLIDFLNSPTFGKEDFLAKARDVTVTGKSGKPAPTFHASPRSSPPFPRIGLRDEDGKVIGAPFVRAHPSEIGTSGEMLVEGTLRFANAAVTGSMIKAAHLALFKLFGYSAVKDKCGQFAAQRLRQFVLERGQKSNAQDFFGDLANSVRLVMHHKMQSDTLKNSQVLLHFFPGGRVQCRLFGVSCVFHANDHAFTVMLPCHMANSPDDALDGFHGYLSDKKMPQEIFVAEFRDGQMAISKSPLSVRYENPVESEHDGDDEHATDA